MLNMGFTMAQSCSVENVTHDELRLASWIVIHVQSGNTRCLASRQIAALSHRFVNAVIHAVFCATGML